MADAIAVVRSMLRDHHDMAMNPFFLPEEADALARVLAVANVPDSVIHAVKHYRTVASMNDISRSPRPKETMKDCDSWLAAVAALTTEPT